MNQQVFEFIKPTLNRSTIFSTASSTPVVIFADALDALVQMQDALVDVVVTSPPYWQQRDYGQSNELGKEANSQEYIDRLMAINRELRRVLKDSGVYFLNIGDKYVKKGLELIPERTAIAMQQEGWSIRNKIIWNKSNPNPSPVKDRFTNTYEIIYMFVKNPNNYLTPSYIFDLDAVRVKSVGNSKNSNNELPRYVKLEEIEKYSNLIEDLPYHGKFKGEKTINRGASAGGRLSINGEYYSKQRKHTLTHSKKLEIIHFLRQTRSAKGISIQTIDDFFNTKHTAGHWFRTDRGGFSIPSPQQWIKLKKVLGIGETKFDREMTEEHYVLQTVRPHAKGKNPGDVWIMPTASLKEKHFAPFPDKLPERCIKACCPEDGIVLDPFVGSGTTMKVASQLNRRSIGIEINPKYFEIIQRVVGTDVTALTL